jgi:peptidoglycan LD-endopeptidase LytH
MNMKSKRKLNAILISLMIGFLAGAFAVVFHYGYLIGHERQSQDSLIPRDMPMGSKQAPAPRAPLRNVGLRDQRSQTRKHLAPEVDAYAGAAEGVPAENEVTRPDFPTSPDVMADAIVELRQRDLLMPLQELKKEDLKDSFREARGSHLHEAIDILAPRNTPVLAVEDGTIARLWYSVPGGITIYQFDPEKEYEYYYAHLERYAEDLEEGARVKRGQVIGYVGTSGNAPKGTPHLHFTIYKLTEGKHWWEGTPINPYLVFR